MHTLAYWKDVVPGRSVNSVKSEPESLRVVASVLGRLSNVSAADTRPDETIDSLAPGWPVKATSLASALRAVYPPAATLGSNWRTSSGTAAVRCSSAKAFSEPPPRAEMTSASGTEPRASRKPTIWARKLR